ncbi:Pol polyprotein [Elysia marginata]|uniref:Pol polyprotein n=1 Tax=Elysia marginata TaxID=1093978 RepID=A0AAV4FAT7_9GAST|nr:Pol polyprotein [Elysia marginata]
MATEDLCNARMMASFKSFHQEKHFESWLEDGKRHPGLDGSSVDLHASCDWNASAGGSCVAAFVRLRMSALAYQSAGLWTKATNRQRDLSPWHTKEHSQHLQQLFTLLSANGLVINKVKCTFGADELDFPGHNVSADGITPLAERVVALRDRRAPQNRSSLQRFLGMINYYHRFLLGLALILAPLQAHSSGKGQNEDSPKECQEAFDSAKEVLRKAVLLHHPQPDAPTSLTVDASNTAVGAQLEQRQGRSWVPLAFFSRKLPDSEKKHSAFDRDLFAFYSIMGHFRHFLEGRLITLYTDHSPLKFALTIQTDRSPRQTRLYLSSQISPPTFNTSKTNPMSRLMPSQDLMQ